MHQYLTLYDVEVYMSVMEQTLYAPATSYVRCDLFVGAGSERAEEIRFFPSPRIELYTYLTIDAPGSRPWEPISVESSQTHTRPA